MGKYWVLLWWARPCSVKLLSYCLLMGGVVLPLVVWPELTQSWSLQAGRAIDDLQEDLYLDCLLGLLLPMPLSPQQATCRFTPLQETCKHSQADLTQSLVGSVLLFPVSWYRQALFVPSMNLCFPQSIIKSCWPSKPDSLGIPNPFVRSPGWEV